MRQTHAVPKPDPVDSVRMMREGRARARAAGRRSEGRPPYGWRAEDGELVPVDGEQAGTARAVALHAEGLSLREIGRKLDEEGYPPKLAQKWSAQAVAGVLRRAGNGEESTGGH